MNTNKTIGYSFCAVLFALAFTILSLTGCPADGNPATITYTAIQTGGVDGTADSLRIRFTFSASVDKLNLTVADITVGGAASKSPAGQVPSTLTGSGKTWMLSPITVNAAGTAIVKITKNGIETTSKRVTVYKGTSEWSITWDLNGGAAGAGEYPAQIVRGEVLAKPSPNPTKANNTFGGWYEDSGLTQAYNFANPVTANLTLYAKWDAASPSTEYWSITWNMNDGVKGAGAYPSQVVKGAVLAKPSPDPTKTGSTFGGWYSNSGLTQTYNFANSVNTNLTLYAKWNAVSLESVTGLANKLAWLQSNAQSNGSYTIEVTVDESIGPHTLSYSGKNNITVTLRVGEGYNRMVSLSSNGTMFKVSSGVTLIIDNIILQGRSANSTNSLVRVEGGTFTMRSGQIRGNTISASGTIRGGGVYVQEGTFRMEGGEISGNTVSNDSSVNNPCYGGGVYVESNGTFTMSGGQIIKNTASGSLNYTRGGGVAVRGAFTMSGGTIGIGEIYGASANKAIFGSGVYVEGNGTFTMTGGEISGNSRTTTSGGGVYVDNNGTFTMSGTAKIYDNWAEDGGGVYNIGTFTMNGTVINKNFVHSSGGGVYNAGTFTMTNGQIIGNSTEAYGSASGGGVYNRGTFTMTNGEISGSSAMQGGGLYNHYGTSTVIGGEISNNAAETAGGGVFASANGTFRIVTGTIYGENAGVYGDLGNYSSGTGSALYSGTSAVTQRGTLNGTTWTSKGTLSTTDNTIKVLNGDIVP